MGGHGGLNILPQKSWHVYNVENRIKVRRDEQRAKATEKQRLAADSKRKFRNALVHLRRKNASKEDNRSQSIESIKLSANESTRTSLNSSEKEYRQPNGGPDLAKRQKNNHWTQEFLKIPLLKRDRNERHTGRQINLRNFRLQTAKKPNDNPQSRHLNLFNEAEILQKRQEEHQQFLEDIGHQAGDVSSFDTCQHLAQQAWYAQKRLPSEILLAESNQVAATVRHGSLHNNASSSATFAHSLHTKMQVSYPSLILSDRCYPPNSPKTIEKTIQNTVTKHGRHKLKKHNTHRLSHSLLTKQKKLSENSQSRRISNDQLHLLRREREERERKEHQKQLLLTQCYSTNA